MIDINLEDRDSSIDEARKLELAMWVMERVETWRRHRNNNFQKRWAEYYRLWRGFWDPQDRNKDSERAKLIAPALQQAVEMTVSEQEEATFGRPVWLDLADDYEDQEKSDIEPLRDILLDEIECHGTKASVSESYLNGALYGTGIGKIMIGRDASGNFKSWLEPISPTNFVIDPSARSIEEALGCAHEMNVPKHKVVRRMKDGIYYQSSLGSWKGDSGMFNSNGESLSREMDNDDAVFLTEYHGLVPTRLLDPEEYKKVFDPEREVGVEGEVAVEEEDYIEAIVTIANEGILLRAVPNPYENPYNETDRAIIAYQHETVPNQFWGRGVSEKGYNPQKALDAELRARIDALGLMTYPVMGIDATRIPRGMDFKIKPGKSILTNGRPSEVLEPIIFGNINPASFQHSSDLERMVQMGTGAMDSAIPTSENRRNETSGGMSMMYSGFVKRAKRTMQNVERNFLTPMVKKMLYRYMQFDPERFPQDFKFKVFASMGIMAREFEQGLQTQLLQVIPPESPLFPLVIKGIVENSSASNRGDLMKALEQMSQPNPEQEAMQAKVQQLNMDKLEAEVESLQAKVALALAQAESARSTAEYTGVKASLEDEKIEIMAAQTVIANKKVDSTERVAQLNAVSKSTDTDKKIGAQKEKQKQQQKGKPKK